MLSIHQEQEGLLGDYESLVGKLHRCRRKKSRKKMARFGDTVVDFRFEMSLHFLRPEKHGRISSFPLERVVFSLYG